MCRVLILVLCCVKILANTVYGPKTLADYSDLYRTSNWIRKRASDLTLENVVRETSGLCRIDEFPCSNGECIKLNLTCDGVFDCTDGSDEGACSEISNASLSLSRKKRESKCRKNQWQCRGGSCINFDEKCDGVVNCPDGSDETFALCRNSRCHSNWFRCAYGACVDGTAPCNNVKDCADNSDELLPRCRDDTNGALGQFSCDNGEVISTADLCDGTKHCSDGSDETLRACAGNICLPYQFQCAYGACNSQDSKCNGVEDCADGSDESIELCRPDQVALITTTTTSASVPAGYCVLPPYPLHGTYTVGGDDKAQPGDMYKSAFLRFTCSSGYGLDVENDFVLCQDGFWYGGEFPKCVRLCRLNPHHSVEYRCLITGPRGEDGSRNCSLYEPVGTVVRTDCKKPNYYTPIPLTLMRCQNDGWDIQHTCTPECGRLTPNGTDLIIGGEDAQRGEIPWHVGVYRINGTFYEQICGGSLVSTTVVISAAHCFWKDVEKTLPASRFAVAVGKLYRLWDSPNDTNAQTSEVAGWGLTAVNGEPAVRLQVAQIPYVDDDVCFDNVPTSFREFVTSDKFCAGYMNGTTLCKGDSGGGLAFPESEKGVIRYYLRGIVSTAPRNNNKCTQFTFTTFTRILKHEHFIKYFL